MHLSVSACDKFLHSRFYLFLVRISLPERRHKHMRSEWVECARIMMEFAGEATRDATTDAMLPHIFIYMWSCRGEQVLRYSRNYYFSFHSTTMGMRRKHGIKSKSWRDDDIWGSTCTLNRSKWTNRRCVRQKWKSIRSQAAIIRRVESSWLTVRYFGCMSWRSQKLEQQQQRNCRMLISN